MLEIKLFAPEAATPVARFGPFTGIRAEGERLFAGPSTQPLLKHQGGVWHAPHATARRLLIDAPKCMVIMERGVDRRTATEEPIRAATFVDGALYTEPSRSLLAKWDAMQQRWHTPDDGSHWDVIIIEAVGLVTDSQGVDPGSR